MSDIAADYELQADRLRRLLKAKKTFEPAMELALDLHAVTHTGVVSGSSSPTFCDHVLEGLTDEDYSVMPTEKDETIAWHLWHIARIEDLVSNLLIARQSQIFDDDWMDRMNVTVKDTGNVMSDSEIISFSRHVKKQELINYRNAVGCQTCAVIKSLTPSDLKRKPESEYLDRLVSEGGLLDRKGSVWLKDFWGSYTVTGLLLLPLTRHHMMHLPDSTAIKEFIKSGAVPFLKG
ncbi:DinB family protein [Hungatella effluvii]|uniref:DinB family protein n=1 Tax=Hungatella effluvii TaxID=1096246 RepID=UPI002A83BEAF|nr:DinB family protein [Hungatella effluvii]